MSAVESTRTTGTGELDATILWGAPVRLDPQPTPPAAPAAAAPVSLPSSPASADFAPVSWWHSDPAPAAASSDFAAHARDIFDRVDTDSDGYLSEGELDAAMTNDSFSGRDAAAVVALAERREALEELANDELGDEDDGVTRADLDAMEALATDNEERAQTENTYDGARNRIRNAETTLYSDGISSRCVRQEQLGDCYFLAAVASLADANPQAIRDMIQDNGDGTYTVTFPGHDPVTVDRPTDAELGRYADGRRGLWVPVLEKGYAAMRRRDDLVTTSGGRRNIEGDSDAQGIQDVTGHGSTTRYTLANGNEGLRDDIRTAISEGRIVTAGIRPLLWGDRDGLPGGHAYSVLGVDADGNIRVRNPWGTGGPNGDGTYTFTPDEFGTRFTDVEIQDR